MANKKILVIDDEPGFSQLIVEYFRTCGYDVFMANDLESAIQLFKKRKPPVVLLDFNMPVITGEKFLPVLQSIDPLVKVIVISGCIEQEVEEKFKGLGYYAFFEKGTISLEKVKKKVDEALAF